MTVERILKIKGTRVHTVAPEATIAEVCKTLTEKGVGALVVSADGKAVLGIISERDIVHVIAGKGQTALATPVRDVMTRQVVTCGLRERIDDMMARMSQGHFRHIPVVENDELCGIISIGDVVKRRLDDVESEATHLREFISGR